MKGSYLLLIEMVNDKKIMIGSLGKIEFKRGYYAYIGSAMNSIEKRIERHLKKEKKMRWHIDYLLQEGEIKNIFYKESNEKEECRIAASFLNAGFSYIKKFGASDCNCKSHLFYSEKENKICCMAKKMGMLKIN